MIMKTQTTKADCLAVTIWVMESMIKVIEVELAYEQATICGRKFGITGEVGEILVCRALGLELVKDPRSQGFDALDAAGRHIQLKTRRGESSDLPKDSGRLSRFSCHNSTSYSWESESSRLALAQPATETHLPFRKRPMDL